jgi:UDP-GlcNAc:undecaprenyl-phosphate GlcNAc-1-phosphate transferase
MTLFLQMALAFGVSAAVLRMLYPHAARLGLLDHPTEERKHHATPVPVIGGIAVLSAIIAASLLTGPLTPTLALGLSGAGVLLVTGMIDDRVKLRASTRLLAQGTAGLILVLGTGLTLTSFGDLFGLGPIELGVVSIPLTVFAIVGVINAINMIDGIDGLAGGLTLITLVSLLVLAPSVGPVQVLMLITIAALIPYLIDNLQLFGRQGHRVFLGDSGSMVLGYLAVWGLIDAASTSGGISAVTAIWLVALPLMDVFRVMLRRARRGISPFAADANHLHHILSALLGSTRKALVAMLIAGTLFAVVGIISYEYQVAERTMFFSALAVFIVYLVVTHVARRWLERSAARSPGRMPAAG